MTAFTVGLHFGALHEIMKPTLKWGGHAGVAESRRAGRSARDVRLDDRTTDHRANSDTIAPKRFSGKRPASRRNNEERPAFDRRKLCAEGFLTIDVTPARDSYRFHKLH